jgi:release factor glutamine methyltransferase
MSSRALIDSGAEKLAAAGIDTARLDAELLLAAAAGATRSEVVAGLVDVEPARAGYEASIKRRVRREPLAYITGRQGFRRIELAVDPRVLIPRPETELLVELALRHGPKSVLDVATGSGAVALALSDELPSARIVASDVSADALALARENADSLGATQVEFAQSDLLESIDEKFDVITANLPYVARGELAGLQPEVSDFEPRLALDGGEDGLDLVRRLVAQAPGRLEPGGMLALEIGLGQAAATAQLLGQHGFGEIEQADDLSGIERVVSGRIAR